jgi:hypothetical protein
VTEDDLAPFRDDPLLVALRAPAEQHELAGEEAAVATFRSSLPASVRRRRALKRAGIGGAGVILGLALTGGVAAAYTRTLPDPVQNAFHAVIDPLPLPAPPAAQAKVHRPKPHVAAPVQPRRVPSPHPTGKPVPGVASPHPTATGPGRPAAAPTRSGAPSTSPTPAPPRPSLTAAVSRRVVPVHAQVVLSGRLSRGAEALPGRLVYAAQLDAGQNAWRRVASGRTGSDGTVSLTVPALTTNVRLRLVTGQGVTSPQLPVSVVPKLSVSSARSGNERVVTVTADGGRPGDGLVLLRRDGDAWTRIGSTSLGSENAGRFTVPGPGAARVRYRVRLPATARHAASFVEFVVPAR